MTLSLSILMLNSQCEEGARDGFDIWYIGVILQGVVNGMVRNVVKGVVNGVVKSVVERTKA